VRLAIEKRFASIRKAMAASAHELGGLA